MADAAGRDEEERLVRACAEGDAAAWGRLVERFGPLLGAVARRLLAGRTGAAPAADVDEVVAEVFLALLRRDRLLLRRYDPRYRLSTYLGVICRTEVLRLLRRRGRAPRAAGPLEEAVPAPEDDPAGPAAGERREEAARVRAALAALASRDRLLLVLRHAEGLSYEAIAAALGVRTASVGPLLHRARRRLARLLGERDPRGGA